MSITAEIIKITKKKSRYGKNFYLTCFKSLNGKSFISYIYEGCRNYTRWKKVLSVGTILSNLNILQGRPNIINADSKFSEVKG